MGSNYWSEGGDLVIEDKTLFRQVGWHGQSGRFYALLQPPLNGDEPGSFAPVYEQIATWVDGGWND